MQSILSYGRFLTRAFVSGLYYSSSSQSSGSTTSINSPQNLEKKLKFITAVSGFSKIVSLDKIRPGKFGDDAYFVARQTNTDVIGVADGVGGWREMGVDPGEFSYSLMRMCERLVLANVFNPCEPGAILSAAYKELLKNRSNVLGSSTACLVVLQGSFGRLCSANLGDSGFIVVRGGSVVHRSQEQQHHFNTPFQLAMAPPGVFGRVLSDRPESASTQEFDVESGDMLLVATDGVFDNLPDSLILGELEKVVDMTDCVQLQKAANAIAQQARTHAFDEQYMSPFALNARKNGYECKGGKPDDITVVVASVIG